MRRKGTTLLLQSLGASALLCAGCAALIVDYPVDVHLELTTLTAEGNVRPDVAVARWDGLWEKPLGVTDSDGRLVSDDTFLWCVRGGQKNPPPPCFSLVLRAGNCAPVVVTKTLAKPSGRDAQVVTMSTEVRCDTDTTPEQ
jgi:hypothetical protein